MLLSGSAGTGKTTVAKALCEELKYDYLFVNASSERGINELVKEKVANYSSSMSMSGSRKCMILDEADSITADAQSALRAIIETNSKNCSFILTCNFKDKLIEPIHSRCPTYSFSISKGDKRTLLADIVKRVFFILDSESVKYNRSIVTQVIGKLFPDFRRTINELQNYSQFGNKIDEGILSMLSDINIIKLYQAMKNKKFHEVREWVIEHTDVDHTRIYRKIYDNIRENLKDESIPNAIVLLADYQYKSSFSADQEVNLLACLVTLMLECEFK